MMASAARTMSACMASADALLQEPPLRLADLVGEEVSRVTARPQGICIRFGSGAAIVIPYGATFDGVGNPVIEP